MDWATLNNIKADMQMRGAISQVSPGCRRRRRHYVWRLPRQSADVATSWALRRLARPDADPPAPPVTPAENDAVSATASRRTRGRRYWR